MLWTRRRFLGSTVAAVATLGAPRAARAATKRIVPDCGLPPSTPGLGPIDVHCHIFNATDLQVERFLTLAVAPHMPRPLQPVVRLLAPVLQKAGWHAAPDGDTELKALQALAVGETTSIDKDRQEGLSRFADAFAEELRTPLGSQRLKGQALSATSVPEREPAGCHLSSC